MICVFPRLHFCRHKFSVFAHSVQLPQTFPGASHLPQCAYSYQCGYLARIAPGGVGVTTLVLVQILFPPLTAPLQLKFLSGDLPLLEDYHVYI